ncbi:hypothetical protein [Acinetobacter brisouii]|uniref:hypothetical protein n=1 Tax=Acinetobacter brisouii TaxID=396323 RepID=UPI00124F5AE8|nr:hypothetical protein [Acinetobacter brisouii]
MKTNKSNSFLLWIIVGVLFAICLAVFVWQSWFVTAPTTKIPATAQHKTQAPPMAQPVASSEPITTASEPKTTQPTKNLVDDSILKQPVPENPSLAKEEVSKLEDIQKQLKHQEATLKAQHSDSDKLIRLKQEEIKLLEQQLAEQQKAQ